MTGESLRDVTAVWNRNDIAVVYVPKKTGKSLLRVPYAPGNKDWLRGDGRSKPDWKPKPRNLGYWEIPRSWFERIVRQCVERFGRVYVIQEHRETEICAPACWNAQGIECTCSCMGAKHGSQDDRGWKVIDETFALRSGERRFACQVIASK